MRVRPLLLLAQGVRGSALQMAEASGLVVPTQGRSQLGHQLRSLVGAGGRSSLQSTEVHLVQQLAGGLLACRAERRQPRIARRVTTRRQTDGGSVEGSSSSVKGLTATTLRQDPSSAAFRQELHSLAPGGLSVADRDRRSQDGLGEPLISSQARDSVGAASGVGQFAEARGTPPAAVLDHLPLETALPEVAVQEGSEGAAGPEEASDAEGRGSGLKEGASLYKIPSGLLPESRKFKIKSAEFIKSSADVSQCPQDGRPEVAVIGRSNVGKSSIINMLTHRRELAQTSKKPGKTQLINHFLINNNWYLVDLPGYGYAVAPKAVKAEWHDFTQKYFISRPNLTTVLLLVDASIPPLQVDLDCADWLGQNKIPVTIVFTKCDRRKKKKNGGRPPAENIAEFERRLGEYYEEPPPWIMTSSVLGMGKDVLLAHIAQVISHWKA